MTVSSFAVVAANALVDPAVAQTGGMVAEHPVTKEWQYFSGGTPPHDIVNGHIAEWRLLRADYRHVFVDARHAEIVQAGKDIDLVIEVNDLCERIRR